MTPEFDINITSISENNALSRIHRWEIARYNGARVETRLTAAFDTAGHDRVRLRLGANYIALRGIIARPLLEYVADFEFIVENASHSVMVTENAVYIPPKMLATMLSIGIGALRGMLAVRTRGTFLARHPLPMLSIGDLLQNLQGASASARNKLPRMEFRVNAS